MGEVVKTDRRHRDTDPLNQNLDGSSSSMGMSGSADRKREYKEMACLLPQTKSDQVLADRC
jgi:hypothetical protein